VLRICPFSRRPVCICHILPEEIGRASRCVCHPETVCARDSISMVRGGSDARCQWNARPSRLQFYCVLSGHLCRFAIPICQAGPRWRSTMAGFWKHPRVTVGSLRYTHLQTNPGQGRMPPTVSRATTSGSSVVPGLAKHTSDPRILRSLS